jgi:hypothetical protein
MKTSGSSVASGPKPVIRWVAVLVGGILMLAGALKLVRPADFHAALLAYDLPLPDSVLRLIAVSLPWLELLCGSCLVLGRWLGAASLLAAAMSFGFCGALAQAAFRGLEIRCGCFGSILPPWLEQPPVALVRAAGLAVGSVWLWSTYGRACQRAAPVDQPSRPAP